jgi:hypothetical protein
MPGVQPGPMPRGFQAAGPISPGGMAAPTPAAQAAMATTQRVARTQSQPRPQPQPKVEWTLPDVATHYNAAAQGSDNFGDTFNKAVAARTQDLLKDARKRGQPLTPEKADAMAYDEIKAWRRENVPEFAPKPDIGPTATQPGETPTLVKTRGEGTLDKPNVEFDRSDWFKLQTKVKLGKPLTAGEQSLADKITGRYGPDPFGSGDLTGNKMFNTVAQGETTPLAAVAPTSTAEVPVVETPKQTRDTTRRDAKRDFLKSLDDDSVDIDKALQKYESVINKQQMNVYLDALKQAEGKADPESLANYALRQKNLPTFDGSFTESRMKPSPSQLQERALAQAWYDDTIKNADKQTKQMYKELLDKKNGDVAQLYREISSKPLGKSFFEEPLNTTMPETMPTPKVEPNAIPETDFTKDLTMAKMSGGDLPVGSFEKDGIRYEVVENASYKNMPDDVKKLVPDMPKTIERQIDIKTGKVLKGPKSMAELQAEAEEMLKQSRASKKAATINTTELKGTEMNTDWGKTPVSGDEYYKHYISGGKSPIEQQYSPGTLAEELYNKVKKDPASLTKEDIKNWYDYDLNSISMPSLKAETKTAKNPKAKTEQEIVSQVSKSVADTIIRNYERIQNQSSFGRPELVGKSLEEAKAIDAKRSQDVKNKQLKANLQEMRTAKENWKAMTEKQRKAFVKKGGRDPSNDIIGGEE